MLLLAMGMEVWLQISQQAVQDVPWWVWIFPVVFLGFLIAGMVIRGQGKGVVRPEKEMKGASTEAKSQPRPRH